MIQMTDNLWRLTDHLTDSTVAWIIKCLLTFIILSDNKPYSIMYWQTA